MISRVLVVVVVLALLWACGVQESSADNTPGDAPAPLPQVGGVQDVWPFAFGFDATRVLVAGEYGQPRTIDERPVEGTDVAASIVEYGYDGVRFEFLVPDDADRPEVLLSVAFIGHVGTDHVGPPGPRQLTVGMSADQVHTLLGEPHVLPVGPDTLAYFYEHNTITVTLVDDRVAEIVLSRAIP